MNIHIELVKKWLADKDSVTQEELMANADAAIASYAASAAVDVRSAYAAYAAADEAALAVSYPATYYSAAADYWVKRYEELTK